MLAVVLLLASSSLCGSERRAVKTMTDADAVRVELAPVRSSIAELAALPRPPSAHGRRRPAERRVVTVEGYVVHVKNENDGDLHVAIADRDGFTMIIEFPDPSCMERSRIRDQATAAGKTMHALLASDPLHGDLKIRVTGVVFFDRYHRQSGVASNAVELHPVLAVKALEWSNPDATLPETAAGFGAPDDRSHEDASAEPSVSHPPPSGCCKVCRTSQPCGDSCISLTVACHKSSGCACSPR